MNEKAKKIATIGWFATATRPGDRTLEQQLIGLHKVLAEVAGKTVIDAGCAEGLLSMEMAKAGAVKCVGLEVVAGHVALGKTLVGDLPCELVVANLNDFDVSRLEPADVVLMLAVLHKLKDPSSVCARLAALAKDLCVIRLPPYGLVIVDDRSGGVPHDIGAVMDAAGFVLESEERGPLDEWLGYFRRIEREYMVDAPRVATVEKVWIDSVPAAVDTTESVESATEAPKTETTEPIPETEAKSGETPTRRRRATKVEAAE